MLRAPPPLSLVNHLTPDPFPPPSYEKSLMVEFVFRIGVFCPCSFYKRFLLRLLTLASFWFYTYRLETVYSDSIRKAELEARLQYLKVSFCLFCVAAAVFHRLSAVSQP